MARQIGIHANTGKPRALAAAKQAKELLALHGRESRYSSDTAAALGVEESFDPQDVESIVVIGGDGTVLRCCNNYFAYSIPILGVNLGTIGFLSEIEAEEMPQALAALAKGEYGVEERLLLSGEVGGQNCYALNDIYVHKNAHSNTVKIAVDVDGARVWNMIADGLIFSTPTGSTAYSLSAGGPVVAPNASVILITPVCAHALSARPIIVEEHARIEVRLAEGRAYISCDGNKVHREFPPSGLLSIRSAREKARFINLGANGFYDRLRRKLY